MCQDSTRHSVNQLFFPIVSWVMSGHNESHLSSVITSQLLFISQWDICVIVSRLISCHRVSELFCVTVWWVMSQWQDSYPASVSQLSCMIVMTHVMLHCQSAGCVITSWLMWCYIVSQLSCMIVMTHVMLHCQSADCVTVMTHVMLHCQSAGCVITSWLMWCYIVSLLAVWLHHDSCDVTLSVSWVAWLSWLMWCYIVSLLAVWLHHG